MLLRSEGAIIKANKIIRKYGTRDPVRLAEELNITVVPRNFKRQKGVYTVIERNRFVFIKADLHPVMRAIVLLHEIAHDQLHRSEAVSAGGFQEFNIFDMTNKRMEYEANVFAAQVSLPDDEILDYIMQGYDIEQIAGAMYSDINLVALKVAELNRQGYRLRRQESQYDFLK